MTDTPLDLDAIEARAAVAAFPDDSTAATFEAFTLARNDVPALVAALRKAEAVIAAYEEDADAALAEKAEAVEAESQIADRLAAERDASRTAHAAFIADLRALVGEWEASPWSWLKTVAAPALRFLLDRHAPTTGETP